MQKVYGENFIFKFKIKIMKIPFIVNCLTYYIDKIKIQFFLSNGLFLKTLCTIKMMHHNILLKFEGRL